MPGDPYNVRERLDHALRVLALSPDPLRGRLISAAAEISPLLDHDFGNTRGNALSTEIGELLTRQETVEASVAGLSDDELVRLAELIFDLDSHYRPPAG